METAAKAAGRALANSHSISPTRLDNKSLRVALADRLSLSEATDAVGRLIARYPNGGQGAGRGYIGGLAAVLLEYPKMIAMRCDDPVRGVPREVKFLPTPSDLIAWCERETKELRRPVDVEDYDAKLRREARERAEAAALLQADRERRPNYAELKAARGPNWGLSQTNSLRPTDAGVQRETIIKANERGHEAMCAHYGVPVNSTASPALLIALGKLDPRKRQEAAE